MSALQKLLAVVLDWPKTTVLFALALVAGGVYVSQRLAVDVFPDIKSRSRRRRAGSRPRRWSSASPCRSSPP